MATGWLLGLAPLGNARALGCHQFVEHDVVGLEQLVEGLVVGLFTHVDGSDQVDLERPVCRVVRGKMHDRGLQGQRVAVFVAGDAQVLVRRGRGCRRIGCQQRHACCLCKQGEESGETGDDAAFHGDFCSGAAGTTIKAVCPTKVYVSLWGATNAALQGCRRPLPGRQPPDRLALGAGATGCGGRHYGPKDYSVPSSQHCHGRGDWRFGDARRWPSGLRWPVGRVDGPA